MATPEKFVLRSTRDLAVRPQGAHGDRRAGLERPRHAGAGRPARRERHAAAAKPARQNALPAAGRRQHDLRQRRDHRIFCKTSPAATGCSRRAGLARFKALTLARLADGIMDASILVVYDAASGPASRRRERWLAHQRGKINRGLAAFAAAPPDPGKTDIVVDRLGLRARLSRLAQAGRLACRPIPAWSTGSSIRRARAGLRAHARARLVKDRP